MYAFIRLWVYVDNVYFDFSISEAVTEIPHPSVSLNKKQTNRKIPFISGTLRVVIVFSIESSRKLTEM